jgi:hypothetical protein
MKDNKHIQSFNEHHLKSDVIKINESDETEKVDVRVKDLIAFLQKFDPETPIYLDKDGWPNELWHERYKDTTPEDKIRHLIDDSGITHRDGNYLIINN